MVSDAVAIQNMHEAKQGNFQGELKILSKSQPYKRILLNKKIVLSQEDIMNLISQYIFYT